MRVCVYVCIYAARCFTNKLSNITELNAVPFPCVPAQKLHTAKEVGPARHSFLETQANTIFSLAAKLETNGWITRKTQKLGENVKHLEKIYTYPYLYVIIYISVSVGVWNLTHLVLCCICMCDIVRCSCCQQIIEQTYTQLYAHTYILTNIHRCQVV